MQTILRWKNWIRIKWHELVTGRVERIVLEDKETGKKHEVVVERQLEKVCDHKTIREIAPTMWRCANPDCDTYFQINYKVMLQHGDLIKFLESIASHLKTSLDEQLDKAEAKAEEAK